MRRISKSGTCNRQRSKAKGRHRAATLSILGIGVSIICAAMSLSARAYKRAPGSEPGAVNSGAASQPVRNPSAIPVSAGLQVERVAILPSGFEPEEIARPAGPFLLAVDNATVFSEASLTLSHEGGSAVAAANLPQRKMQWREVVDLTPGYYLLTDAKHPGFVCRITIAQ